MIGLGPSPHPLAQPLPVTLLKMLFLHFCYPSSALSVASAVNESLPRGSEQPPRSEQILQTFDRKCSPQTLMFPEQSLFCYAPVVRGILQLSAPSLEHRETTIRHKRQRGRKNLCPNASRQIQRENNALHSLCPFVLFF